MCVSTLAISNIVDPPAQRERALMPALVNPMDGPYAWNTALMTAVILSPRIWYHLFSFLVLEIGVLPVAPLRQRYTTRKHMADTGHPWGCPVLSFPIYLPLNIFFCFVKSRLTKYAWARMSLVAVATL